MEKKLIIIILAVGMVFDLALQPVSAGWFSDFWGEFVGKITGKVGDLGADYECTGTSTPCSSFSTETGCLAQTGCSWIAGGGAPPGSGEVISGFVLAEGSCSGTQTSCSGFNTQSNCLAQTGCSWTGTQTSQCGDSVVDTGEVCDDGNTVTETSCDYGTASCVLCNADCSQELSLTGLYCGDGIVNASEQCDDGNTNSSDGCGSNCQIEESCVGNVTALCDEEFSQTGCSVFPGCIWSDTTMQCAPEPCSAWSNDQATCIAVVGCTWQGEDTNATAFQFTDPQNIVRKMKLSGLSAQASISFGVVSSIEDIGEVNLPEESQVLRILNISSDTQPDTTAELSFSLSKNETQLSNPENVDLYILEGENLVKLATTYMGEDELQYNYSAEVEHFSVFLIIEGSSTPQSSDCGNNVAESGELCDGSDLRQNNCESLGYDSGTLSCTSSCEFDTSGCIGGGGSGSQNGGVSPGTSTGQTKSKSGIFTVLIILVVFFIALVAYAAYNKSKENKQLFQQTANTQQQGQSGAGQGSPPQKP